MGTVYGLMLSIPILFCFLLSLLLIESFFRRNISNGSAGREAVFYARLLPISAFILFCIIAQTQMMYGTEGAMYWVSLGSFGLLLAAWAYVATTIFQMCLRSSRFVLGPIAIAVSFFGLLFMREALEFGHHKLTYWVIDRWVELFV